MPDILSLFAIGKLSYSAGASGTVTVTAGKSVIGVSCISTSAPGTLTIAIGGPNQPSSPSAGDAIPVPVGAGFSIDLPGILAQMGPGTVLTFANTDSYVVWFTKAGVG